MTVCLRRFAVVRLNKSTEFFFASNAAQQSRTEVRVEGVVADICALMWAFHVVVHDPRMQDVVELFCAETDEVI